MPISKLNVVSEHSSLFIVPIMIDLLSLRTKSMPQDGFIVYKMREILKWR